jgi:glutathione gamma-glutamylcysteinyltransferase
MAQQQQQQQQQQPAVSAAAAPRSFYRRELPPSCVAFSSAAGRALFAEALASGGAEGYFRLAECFHTQSEPAFCGLGALAMTLNALSVDPGRVWKGAWRWFDESMLDCCVPLEAVAREGIVLDALACLARCNGAAVRARRAPPEERQDAAAQAQDTAASAPAGAGVASGATPTCTYEEFLSDLRAACFAPADAAAAAPPAAPCHVIVSYSRGALGQSGGGHFSPVGAFAPASGMVLILDVARFKYPPHWVSIPALWAAMRRADPATGLPRGYLRLCAAPAAGAAPVGAFVTLSRRRAAGCACAGGAADAADAWFSFLAGLGARGGELRAALSAAAPEEAETTPPMEALRAVAKRVVAAVAHLPPMSTAVERYDPAAPCDAAAAEAVLACLRGSALRAALQDAVNAATTAASSASAADAWEVDALALLLLAAPRDAWTDAARGVLQLAQQQLPVGSAASDEVSHLRAQLEALTCCEVAACDAKGGRAAPCCPQPGAAAAERCGGGSCCGAAPP